MMIYVDTRERKLYPLINSLNENFSIHSETLDLGDIVIKDKDDREVFIIERKSVADLAASIIDGRYKEQSFRLSNCGIEIHRVIYIIEGNLDNIPRNCPIKNKKTLNSALLTLSLQKGFTVYHTQTIVETAELILLLTEQSNKAERKPDCDTADDYSRVCKRVKKANITPTVATEILLAQIPGVSISVAKAIVNDFATMELVIETIKHNPSAIDALTLSTKSGGKRKIPAKTSNILKEYLLCDTANITE